MAGLSRVAPVCSPELSDRHRALALEQDTAHWLNRPEVSVASALAREANYDDEQRKRRIEHLASVRNQALEALRRSIRSEKENPELARARKIARSKAHRHFRAGGVSHMRRPILLLRCGWTRLSAAQVL